VLLLLLLLLCPPLQAHARLCARSCVTLQDAVMAVLILDSSMTGSSLMGWSNALHTHFPDDPDAEYDLLERQVCVVQQTYRMRGSE
jgi:DNA helicase MCM9